MLGAIAILLGCQLAGEALVRLNGLPVPGPVAGMALLFGWLIWRGRIPAELEQTGNGLLRVMALLFVPAGVGLMAHFPRLQASWAPILAAVVPGTLITIVITGWLMQSLNRRLSAAKDPSATQEAEHESR